jgi:hypothetical protein
MPGRRVRGPARRDGDTGIFATVLNPMRAVADRGRELVVRAGPVDPFPGVPAQMGQMMARFGDKRPHMNATGMASVRVMARLASPSAPLGFCGLRHKWFRAVRLLAVITLVAFATTIGIGTSAMAPAGAVTPRQTACSVLQGHGISWPKASWVTCLPGAVAQSSPTVADWQGMTIVAVGDESGRLNVFNAATGEELPGWPEKLAAPAGAAVAIESSPTIAFLDGPNKPPSIIVGAASTWVNNTAREVEAFQLSGAPRFIFHVRSAPGTAVGVISTPAVGSLTASGQQDIVFGSWDHHIYALTPAGRLLPGFPINNADTIWSSPALYRVPGTIGDSIFIGGDAHGRHGCRGGWITDYRYVGTAPTIVWQHCESQTIWSSPAVGVINSTGRAVVVVGTGFYWQPFPSGTYRMFAYYADNGAPVPGWPVKTSGPALGSPAIGIINSTGTPAVVETSWVCSGVTNASCLGSNTSMVTAWNGGGRRLWTDELRGPTTFSSPVLVPLQDGTSNDILIGSGAGLYAISGQTGAYLFGTSFAGEAIDPGCRVFNSVAVADVLGTGASTGWSVIEACGGPAAFNYTGRLVSYQIPTPPMVAPAWPMFHQNATHDGVATCGFSRISL